MTMSACGRARWLVASRLPPSTTMTSAPRWRNGSRARSASTMSPASSSTGMTIESFAANSLSGLLRPGRRDGVIRPAHYTPEIGRMGGRPRRPARQEAADESRSVVMNRQRVDAHAVTDRAVSWYVRAGDGGDARDEPVLRGEKVRHAGGAVVDDGQVPAGQRETAPRGEIGVCARHPPARGLRGQMGAPRALGVIER